MSSFGQWRTNRRASLIVSAFLVGAASYLFSSGDYSDAVARRRQLDIASDVRETIVGELYDMARKRELLFKLNAYCKTNDLGAKVYDFDALSRELIMRCYRGRSFESNKVDFFDTLIDAGHIRGLTMSLEILDEIQKQH